MPLLWVNNRQPILYTTKKLPILIIQKSMNQFTIGYIVNTTLHADKLLREQVDKFSRENFHQNTMTSVRNVLKNNKCFIALIMFYENRPNNATKLYRVLICIIYSIIENFVCVGYICCQSKTISEISSDKLFEDNSYNELLGIVISEVLMNLISCQEFMKSSDSTVMLVFRSRLVNYYLSKGFIIL